MGKILTNRWFQTYLLLALLLATVFYSFSHDRWRKQIQNFTFDTYNILKPRQAGDDIVIVDIDEASLERIGQHPWPRTVMAELVEKLDQAGAGVVVFDIVFSEPDRTSPAAFVGTVENLSLSGELVAAIQSLPDHDAVFGQAIEKAGNVVTGFSFTAEKTPFKAAQKGIYRGKNLQNFVPILPGITANLKDISKGAAGNGSFFVSTDTDGIIRRVPMLVGHKSGDSSIVTIYPSLSLEAVRVLKGERGAEAILEDAQYAALDPNRFGIKGIQIGREGQVIPTNARGEFLVYFAKSRREWYIPAYQILEGSYAGDLTGKIVLIGTSAVGLKDIRSSPLDPFIPGVEMHLNIIDQILQERYLQRSIYAEGLEAVAILAAGLFIIFVTPLIGALLETVIVAVTIGAALYGGWYAFTEFGLLIDVAYITFALIWLFILSTILTYLRLESEKRQVRNAFGLYISPDFMKELTRHPDKLKLGGEIRDLTIMFTDIRNFTTISEGLSPEALIQLMNDFLTPMSDLVMQNRGTIDKYMGDAMMAFWNAPLDDPNHARHACIAALGMQKALRPINDDIALRAQREGRKPVLLNAGIGINTGPSAVGNMGSRQRFAYSTLSDAVNMASRLEGQTKAYGVQILIGETTARAVSDFAVLEADLIRVKGKTRAEHIYILLGDSDLSGHEAFRELKDRHEKFLAAYRRADLPAAHDGLEECRGVILMRDDLNLGVFYDVYEQRLKDFKVDPPPKDWDGVFEAKSK